MIVAEPNIYFYSCSRIIMPRQKLDKDHLHIYIDKTILSRIKKIAEEEGITLSELVEYKLKEVIALREAGLPYAGGGIRTHDPRGERLSRPPPYHSATPALTLLIHPNF